MLQKGSVSVLPMLIIMAGLVVGVYFIESGTGFFSKAWDMVGPSKSATIKIPVKTATESANIASGSAQPKASASASASASVKPQASASASASAKPAVSATPSASPKK